MLQVQTLSRAPFHQEIAQQAERVLGVHEAAGSKPVFLTISEG
jgi:hypothetical protein